MMKINVKHVVEIAGGLIVGSLASDALNGVVNVVKKQVNKVNNKKAKEAR